MITILLADDHAIVRSGIKLLINRESDMEVLFEAEDGETAVKKAIKNKPDIVIMDLNMPKKDGLIATQQIKEANENIQIIILTMYGEKEYISRVLQVGASGFVLKNHNENNLIEAIRTVHRGEAYLDSNATKILINDYVNISQDDQPQSRLTVREQEVLLYLAKGYTNKEVAKKLYVSIKTIEAHRSNIMRKLNIKTRRELVKYAIDEGYLNLAYNIN